MSTPPQSRRSSSDAKKPTPTSSIVTRNGARKAKIQTRAMSAGSAKPSASLLAAKKKAQLKKKQNMDTVLKDPYQIAQESKLLVRGATGLVTDPRMVEHRCLWDDLYPECPERLTAIIERCTELNLLERCHIIEPRLATLEEVSTLHSPQVYELLKQTHENEDIALLEEISSKLDAIYIHPSTHFCALSAAGCALALVDAILGGAVRNGAALVRPPGHHAGRAEPCGYCFYNNAALAVRRALFAGAERVLLLDWDVHHGQASQQLFYADPRVLYFSLHRYEHGAFWPALRQADFAYVGAGRAAGRNVNVPLNATGMGDADYLAVWHHLLLPMMHEGEMAVSAAGFAWLSWLAAARSRTALVLEGGYCARALADGAALSLRALLGSPPPPLPPLAPLKPEMRETILNCIYVHKPYWKCFQYQPTYSIDPSIPNVDDVGKEKHEVRVLWKGDETRPTSFLTRDCYPVQDNNTKKQLEERLEHLWRITDLSEPEHAVCYAYDPIMLKHVNICEPGHVECPDRILRVHRLHEEFGLLKRLHILPPRLATDQEILTVHTAQYLDRLKRLSALKPRQLRSEKEAYESVYFHPESLASARAALGAALAAAEAVAGGAAGAASCAVRPPGHHAAAAAPSGFCLLNNAAAAALHAVRALGLRRVLLLDWDVHHGDGSQQMLYHTPEVLYMSLHRFDNGSFFPHSPEAAHDRVGAGAGRGFNVNIPWNKRGMGDVEYLAAFTQVVLPIATQYNPELVIVSAGFDAAIGDPLGGCKVTPECFGYMTSLLRCLAGGKIVLCLEGGYNVTSTAYSMTMCTKALLGDPIPYSYDPKPEPHWSAVETINNVISVHKQYWSCLKFQVALPLENVLEPPCPSRGLNLDGSDANDSSESDILSETLSSTLNISRKSQLLEGSLESAMINLSIDSKTQCLDGNCGTDDEDESKPGPSKSAEKTKDLAVAGGSSRQGPAQTLVDYLAENMQAIVNEEMFAVVPVPWCPHIDYLPVLPEGVKFEQGARCVECGSVEENWVCLHCYVTACARSVQGHMQQHCSQWPQHALLLSLSDLSVWCNPCGQYVDHEALHPAKDNAHRLKFGEPMAWCYSSQPPALHME